MGIIDINGEEKIISEQEYRKRIYREAQIIGCEKELLEVFKKYDNLLRNCRNQQEREHIGMLGVLAVSELLDGKNVGKGGELVVNGQVVLSEE